MVKRNSSNKSRLKRGNRSRNLSKGRGKGSRKSRVRKNTKRKSKGGDRKKPYCGKLFIMDDGRRVYRGDLPSSHPDYDSSCRGYKVGGGVVFEFPTREVHGPLQ